MPFSCSDKLESLRSKVIKEFNQMFFNGQISFMNIPDYKYAVEVVNSQCFEQVEPDVITGLLKEENSLKAVYDLVIEFRN